MKLQTSHYELGQELKFWTQQSATGCAPLKSLQNLRTMKFEHFNSSDPVY